VVAGGDALQGNVGALCIVRREVCKIITRGGEPPRVGRIVWIGLKLDLRALKSRLVARGKFFIRRVIGKNNCGGEKKNYCGGQFAFGHAPAIGIKSCHHARLFYTGQVRLNWNFLGLAMLMVFALALAGCSGINTGTSVSPASFFLPGILKADPPMTNAPVAAIILSNQNQLALAR
jgi:hypothetical protein